MDMDIYDLINDRYYGPLLYSYIDTILSSGELLEDDFEVILSVYRIDDFCINHKTYFPYCLVASAFSVFPLLVVSKKLGLPLIVVPSLLITTSLACCKIYERKTAHCHQILIQKLVEVLRSIQDVNKKIKKYFIERKAYSSNYSRELFQPFTNAICYFMKVVFKEQNDIHYRINVVIGKLSNFCEPLKEDCNILEHYHTIGDQHEEGVEDYLKYLDHVINFQQLLTSKLLSYIAILFCWDKSTITKKVLEKLLNSEIPSLLKLLNHHRNNIMEQFQSLRSTVSRFSKSDFDRPLAPKNRISGKFRNALDSSINNISFVLEKLYNIVDVIDETDGEVNQKIDEAFVDLRNHTAATYETLDILCKIYGILMDTKKKSDEANTLTRVEEIKSYNSGNTESLQIRNVKDPRDLIEDKEKYELFITASDIIDQPIVHHGETSDAYMKIMIKELKRNLKQHEFYVSAKKRWIDDSEGEQCSSDSDVEHPNFKNEITRSKLPPVSSQVNSVKATVTDNSNNTIENKTQQTEDSNESINEISTLQKLENESENQFQKRDTLTRVIQIEEQENWNPILKGIKNFSQNIQVAEETFGEDENSD